MTLPGNQLDHADAPVPPEPPPAPRPLTPLVRRRAWGEKRVRIWWIMGAVLFVIAVYYAVSRIYFWNDEARLVRTGKSVEAEVMGWEIGGDAPKDKLLPPDAAVDVQYTYEGQTYRKHGELGGRKEQILTRRPVKVFIDPKDPGHWTARQEPASLWQELISAMLLVPFVVVLLALALWQRQRVLGIYRNGTATLADVVGVGHSAAAPLSRLLRCATHGDGRVLKTLLPAAKAPAVGQSLWLIHPEHRPDQAVPAALFE